MTDEEIQKLVARPAAVTVFSVREARPDASAPLLPLSSLPLNAGRFNYFYIEVINPYCPDPRNPGLFEPSSDDADLAVHKWQDRDYRERFESGEEQAIFDYAAADPDAFDSAWLRTQVKAWRLEATRQASGKLARLMTEYRGRRGKRSAATLLDEIDRDQRIFQSVEMSLLAPRTPGTRRPRKYEIIKTVADKNYVSRELVQEVDRRYREYYTRIVPECLSADEFFVHLAALLVRMRQVVAK